MTSTNKYILKQYAKALKIPYSWLYTVLMIESKGNPQAVNPYTGATGLIQFMPSTAYELGTSTSQLYNMNFEQQMLYVYKYLNKFRSKIKSLTDLYLSVFYPVAIGKSNNFILGSERGTGTIKAIKNQNSSFSNTPYIKKGDIVKYVKNKYNNLGFSNLRYIFEALTH